MALGWIFGDSFDKYPVSLITTLWTATVFSGGASSLDIGPYGRFGTNGLRTNAVSGGASGVYKTLGAASQKTYGVAFRPWVMPIPGSFRHVISYLDAAQTQLTVRLNPDGTLGVCRSETELGRTTYALGVGNYYFLEIDAQIGPSSSLNLRINGVSKLVLTGVNTQFTVNASSNGVCLGSVPDIPSGQGGLYAGGDFRQFDFDDVYVGQGGGGGFYGDIRGRCIYPNGAGAYAQFTLFDLVAVNTQNWQSVKEHAPDSDITYNYAAIVGKKDMFNFDDIAGTGVIVSVVASLFARKDDSGLRTVQVGYRHGGTDHFGTSLALDGTYTYLQQVWELNPITAAAWLWVDINADQFGYMIDS